MSSGPQTFKKTWATRAIDAAHSRGLAIDRMVVMREGLTIYVRDGDVAGATPAQTEPSDLDKELAEFEASNAR
jgi:hypothetical protein